MEDLQWIIEIEAKEYYIIDSKTYNEHSLNKNQKLKPDEWVLIEITDQNEELVYFNAVHHNLYPTTKWGGSRNGETSREHFNENLVGSGYWKPVYELPKYTLFEHENNRKY